MSVKIKVCGITDLEAARYLAGKRADYLGFIQHEESPRYIRPKQVAKILEWVHGIDAVGVFVNDDADAVNHAVETAGFTHVQLHGTEPPAVCAQIDRPVIKAIRVRHDAASDQLRALMEPYTDVVDAFLLDTHNSSVWGGTGESFNWRLARELSSEFRIFLAGGLNANNIERAIHTMRPYAVDLSSGLETAPGVKSLNKIDAFFDTFRAIQDELAEEEAADAS